MTEKKKHKISYFIILYGGFAVYSVSSVFAKQAGVQDKVLDTFIFFILEFLLLGIYAIIYQQALKRFSLTMAMSSKGSTVLMGLVWSVLIFKEEITLLNIIGVVLVMAGVIVVSADD